mgnify:CR=1 FL=1
METILITILGIGTVFWGPDPNTSPDRFNPNHKLACNHKRINNKDLIVAIETFLVELLLRCVIEEIIDA